MRGQPLARKVRLKDGWRSTLEARLEQSFGKSRELCEGGSTLQWKRSFQREAMIPEASLLLKKEGLNSPEVDPRNN